MAKGIADAERTAAARAFAEEWSAREGSEKSETQIFWLSLLRRVYGVEEPERYIEFEKRAGSGFADAYIQRASVLIEQKSADTDLDKRSHNDRGALLTPFEQAKRYVADLPRSQHPRWIIVSNFREIRIHNMDTPLERPKIVRLENLKDDWRMLMFLVDLEIERVSHETDVSFKAGELIGRLYRALLRQYGGGKDAETLHSLNVLCVRLVFCLYAENADVFPKHGMFRDYLNGYSTGDQRDALVRLFEVLDQKEDERDPYISEKLAQFPYVNGGLFSDKIAVPPFDREIRDILLKDCSEELNWSKISPTIFGAIFESTLNPETRSEGGMHYTSIENIHKVIDPLFLDDLKGELASIRRKRGQSRKAALREFRRRLGEGRYLDPACGSGNFLTETYLSLRRLENEALNAGLDSESQTMLDDGRVIQVSLAQFGGIEINDFAVTVAKTALWIAESQMMAETERIVNRSLDFLPLKNEMRIIRGNALRTDWSEASEEGHLFIIGNPPFIGARIMRENGEQKADVSHVFAGWRNTGDLDYVSCWFKKAADFVAGTDARCALVATSSICQGVGVSTLWEPLMREGVHIDFAHRPFKWSSESEDVAQVHCVIVGFSSAPNPKPKRIYTNGVPVEVDNISAYLVDADDVYVKKRSKPFSKAPMMRLGGQAIDDGNLVMTKEEKEELLRTEPQAEQFIRPYMMGEDFVNRKPRYCLWLRNVNPSELRRCPKVLKRVKNVEQFRKASTRKTTLRAAEQPALFASIVECLSDYVALPKVSSSNRKYIPIDFLDKNIIPGDKLFLMPECTVYHFGVLTSSAHMAWTRAVCGRLGDAYSYSNTIVYNNFPWPEPTKAQREKIERTAQGILDARANHPESSLVDLYDDLTMPPDLRKAHDANDRAVLSAYGLRRGASEEDIVAELMRRYKRMTEEGRALQSNGGETVPENCQMLCRECNARKGDRWRCDILSQLPRVCLFTARADVDGAGSGGVAIARRRPFLTRTESFYTTAPIIKPTGRWSI